MNLSCWILWLCVVPIAIDLMNIFNYRRDLPKLTVLGNCIFAVLISGATIVAINNKFGLSCCV
jgi:hypothetical protein